MDKPDCRCETPNRPLDFDSPPWKCLTCGGYACEYADPGKTRCDSEICDCFIATYPDSPRDLHPEAFIVTWPEGNKDG